MITTKKVWRYLVNISGRVLDGLLSNSVEGQSKISLRKFEHQSWEPFSVRLFIVFIVASPFPFQAIRIFLPIDTGLAARTISSRLRNGQSLLDSDPWSLRREFQRRWTRFSTWFWVLGESKLMESKVLASNDNWNLETDLVSTYVRIECLPLRITNI